MLTGLERGRRRLQVHDGDPDALVGELPGQLGADAAGAAGDDAYLFGPVVRATPVVDGPFVQGEVVEELIEPRGDAEREEPLEGLDECRRVDMVRQGGEGPQDACAQIRGTAREHPEERAGDEWLKGCVFDEGRHDCGFFLLKLCER